MITKTDYKYETVPYKHQHDIFMESRDAVYWGILAEPGTGKSKITIDTAAWQFMNGKINLLLVAAPNGVHRKWIRKEIPAHLPSYIERPQSLQRVTGRIVRLNGSAGGHRQDFSAEQLVGCW